ncbi:MAG: zinc-ribbon domain-containing protein [Gemmatimonadales bacterium]
MNVVCPTCATVYRVDPAKVPAGGVRARCGVCAAVFPVSTNGASPAAVVPAPVVLPPVAVPAAAPAAPMPPAGGRPAIPTGLRPSGMFAPPAMPGAAPASRPSVPMAAPKPSGPSPVAPVAPAPRPPVPPVQAAPVSAPAAPTPAPRPPVVPGRGQNPFMSQDPSQKARRLARALVSDLVVYGAARRDEALKAGTLKEVFGEEIKKSWQEFVDQVGKEMAESTPYFNDALNDILAGGQKIF